MTRMKFLCLALSSLALIPAAYAANEGTIMGAVKGPQGELFLGAFVRVRNTKTKITINLISNGKGAYRAANLPPGEYEIRATAVGYEDDIRKGVAVSGAKPVSLDFALKPGTVRWSDLNTYQGKKLLPDGKGKEIITAQCLACHGFQTRMAALPHDQAGWTKVIDYMRVSERARLANHFSDGDANTVILYLNAAFGPSSKLPKSPSLMPGYQDTVRPVAEEGTRLTYVEYEMPAPNRHPFSAIPDKDGSFWIPFFGRANRVGHLNPDTGAIEEFLVPHKGTAGIHTVVPAADGTVWIGEQASNKLAKLDPKTKEITEYQDVYAPGLENLEDGGSKHTIRVDPKGKIWGTGVRSNLTLFDPKTHEFMRFKETFSPYGVEIDKDGNPWFAEFYDEGSIGKVDAKTGKVTKWKPPTPKGWPRRIEFDSKGNVWFAEFRGGKIGRFDPKTETFKEYTLPGPSPTPYGLGIDRNDVIWYSSDEQDVIGRLDPKTGKVVEYPFPHSENTIKELFLDAKGRMWYATASNNKVGYFIPLSD